MATQHNQDAVKNQKVFVALEDVITLQTEINRLVNDNAILAESQPVNATNNKKYIRGLIKAAEILGLPLKAPFNY